MVLFGLPTDLGLPLCPGVGGASVTRIVSSICVISSPTRNKKSPGSSASNMSKRLSSVSTGTSFLFFFGRPFFLTSSLSNLFFFGFSADILL